MYSIEHKAIGLGEQRLDLPLGSEIVAAYRDGGRVMLAYRRLVIAPAMEEHRVLAVQYGKSFDYAGAGELRFIGEVGFHAADGGRVYVFEIARR